MRKGSFLIVDSSENNSDLLYRTRFFVPDPVIFIEHNGKSSLVLNDLEYERGINEANVDEVISLSECTSRLSREKKKKGMDMYINVIELVLRDKGIKNITVQRKFPLFIADGLREKGFSLKTTKDSFLFPERDRKTDEEIQYIKNALRNTQHAMDRAIKLIGSCGVKNGYLYVDNKVITSERVKQEIDVTLASKGFTSTHTIVASGIDSSMPHNTGSGRIREGVPVIIDIFPRDQNTGYFGDMTRTVVKGKPSKELSRMYSAVLAGQKLALGMISSGVRTKDIHNSILELFEAEGFSTGTVNGKPRGFIHSTGHGLGLDIHEPPRIGDNDEVLRAGNVVTVEPGLYYEHLGGIRLEDVVVVTEDGCINLTRFRKKFRI